MITSGRRGTLAKAASFFLVLSFVGWPGSLAARERRGAQVVAEMKDGSVAAGELIAVRQGSLVILKKDDQTDVSVPSGEIKSVKILKKSKAGSGFGYGLLAGAATGVLLGLASGSDEPHGQFTFSAGGKALLGGVVLGLAGGLLGLVIGAGSGMDETVQIDGLDKGQVQIALQGLKAKARIPDAR